MTFTSQTIIRKAREFPILECLISPGWQQDEPGLVEVMVVRQQPDGNICFGMYLVDKLCLGLKNTLSKVNYSPARLRKEILLMFQGEEPTKCTPELAHQMVYASIDYAAQFGFQPEKDFAQTQLILEPHGALNEPYQLKFGRNGKPFFVAGPYDDTRSILNQLEKTAGPGNYDYLAMVPGMTPFDVF